MSVAAKEDERALDTEKLFIRRIGVWSLFVGLVEAQEAPRLRPIEGPLELLCPNEEACNILLIQWTTMYSPMDILEPHRLPRSYLAGSSCVKYVSN